MDLRVISDERWVVPVQTSDDFADLVQERFGREAEHLVVVVVAFPASDKSGSCVSELEEVLKGPRRAIGNAHRALASWRMRS